MRKVSLSTRALAAAAGVVRSGARRTESAARTVVSWSAGSAALRVARGPRALATGIGASPVGSGSESTYSTRWGAAAAAAAVAAATVAAAAATTESKSSEAHGPGRLHGGERVEGLAEYTMEEVARHRTAETGLWVVFRNGVYDVTEFVAGHPGGDKILLAAGGSIEPFWELYAAHNQEDVHDVLETLRIGNLSLEDVRKAEEARKAAAAADPYAGEPMRLATLQVANQKPFNAETPPPLLVESFLTPNELFYVRNHLPVPRVDPATFRLRIEGLGVPAPVELSLEDLRTRFPVHTIATSIQCAGNRRKEMSRVRDGIKGLSWDRSAIGTATWTGVRLRDVLKFAGFDVEANAAGAKHVQVEGLDRDMTGQAYGASIPAPKALSDTGDVLLAWEMNGKPIPRDHGYPLRLIVPGVVGARNVKWVSKIVPSVEESASFWQQKDYKGFHPSADVNALDWKGAYAIQDMPVQATICDPPEGGTVDAATTHSVKLRGYAWSGGGRGIIRVDATADGGRTWVPAKLLPKDVEQPVGQEWAWTLWEAEVPVPASCKEAALAAAAKSATTKSASGSATEGATAAAPGTEFEVAVRAVDSAYNVQPERVEPIWNIRGLLNNSWHRIPFRVEASKP